MTTANAGYASGHILGTGAAQNIEIGFIPSYVRINAIRGTTLTDFDAPMARLIAFDGGGGTATEPNEIKPGMFIQASDEGWSAAVKAVIRASGTWAGGDAAGWLELEPDSIVGAANIADNDDIRVSEYQGVEPAGNWATTSAAGFYKVQASTTLSAAIIADNQIVTPYVGSTGDDSRGFTIPAALGGSGNIMYYQAWA